jgi:hypothetical protein
LHFPDILLRYSLNVFEVVPLAPIITSVLLLLLLLLFVVIVVVEEGKVEVEEEKFQFVMFTCQNASVPECHISDI